jgi:20S proteasome subunit alpha 6
MLKSPYDTDCITWSPQGRLFQIEYAMEAIKQGSLCVGLKSSQYAILATLNRSPSKLADYQQKIYEIDEHLGLCFSGLTADGRLICKYLRTEALNYRYTYGTNINPQRLVNKLSEKAQIKTQRHSKRPYGVGCLIAGYDVKII